ncbi:potassium voltage-gated channel subfamily H member 6 isoform X3 [Nematostella vectensis]|uniref:potassium voltage-gated channel subfamily H member 6 isoform X3 n=1 Tax=Nematostella vectensis TaxID=45351 RepID=UPI0020773170|nr:potassium voltage-gated channel subfamily H member 6 isoform X3 [Nematostella vectensis]
MACRTYKLCRAFVSEVMSLNPTSTSRTQAKIHPWTIRHDSLFKAIWDWLILILVMYTAIEIPYTVVFSLPYQVIKENTPIWFLSDVTPLHVCNLWVDLMFIVDIFINFRSTYVAQDSDEIISNPKNIGLHYLKTWFVVDFFAAIPFEFMINPTKEGAATLMGLFKTARLLRLVRVARKLDRYSEYGLAVVVLLTCLFMLLAHWLACIWHAIGHHEIHNTNGWIWLLAMEGKNALKYNASDHSTWPNVNSRYVTSLYFTLTSLTTVGFGNVSPNTNAEKAFSVCVMLVGALFYAAIFGNMTAIIQRLYSRTSRFHRDLRVIEEFSKFNKVPPSLRDDLEEFFRHEWIYTKGVDVDHVLKRFPECLQADVRHHLHKKLFNECMAFANADDGCLRALSLRFTIQHFLPGHFVVKQGDQIDRLLFLVKGSIEVIKDKETCLVLGKGDTISCDYSSINSSYIPKANASLLIQTHSEIHSITWSDLLIVLKAYPTFQEDFLDHLELAYNLGNIDEEIGEDAFLLDDPSKPPVRRLSNARQNLKSNPASDISVHKYSNTNGSLPNQLSGSIRHSEDGTIPTNESNSVPTTPSLDLTQEHHLRDLYRRIANIDKRMSSMEDQVFENFQRLFEMLERREGKDCKGADRAAPRTTNV